MRLMPLLTMAVALAMALSMLTLSGVGGELGHSPDTQIEGELEDTAGEIDEDEFDPDEGGDSLLGSTVAAINTLRSMVGMIIFLPSTLESLGAPGYFARIVGHGAQLVIGLGLAQVIRGFEIR